VLSDFFRNEPVEFQTTLVDEIMSHMEGNKANESDKSKFKGESVKGDDDRLRRAKQKKQSVMVTSIFVWKRNIDGNDTDFYRSVAIDRGSISLFVCVG
jgi:hypothetical protein